MAKRFEYDRMTGEEFAEALADIDMKPETFARLFGQNADRVKKWADGREDVPTWVPPVVAMLANCPGTVPEARATAAQLIRLDNLRPELGEYPYQGWSEGHEDD